MICLCIKFKNYNNGIDRCGRTFINDIKDGSCVENYEDGTMKEMGILKDGKKNAIGNFMIKMVN